MCGRPSSRSPISQAADWPNLSRRAAIELVKAAAGVEPSLNIRLLGYLLTIFERLADAALSTLADVLARPVLA